MTGDKQYVLNAETGQFYSGTASLLPCALHSSQMITTLIFNIFLIWRLDFFNILFSAIISAWGKKGWGGGGKIILQTEALEVLISEGLGLFQVTAEV